VEICYEEERANKKWEQRVERERKEKVEDKSGRAIDLKERTKKEWKETVEQD